MRRKGFTLIELVIAVSISIMITMALYFSLRSALDSWQIAQDRLSLQQVSARLMEDLSEGVAGFYGVRDAMEIVNGSSDYLSVVFPWTDDTHNTYTGIYTFTLNRHLKPGASLPLAEALLPEQTRFRVVPIRVIDPGKTPDYPQVFIKEQLPAGARLRFTFYPDYRQDGDVVATYRYDSSARTVFVEDKDGSRDMCANSYGVRISEFMFRYFDTKNKEVGVNGSISTNDIPLITAVEISFTAVSATGSTRHAKTFVSLRNAPFHSGNIILKEGARIPIPNSTEIKAFALTNLWGIDNKDSLELMAKSSKGQTWVVMVKFSKASALSAPLIESYTVDYPDGNRVYTDKPRLPVEAGLNFLMMDPGALYDYGFDDINDAVKLEGTVELYVKKMDITGAAIFVRP